MRRSDASISHHLAQTHFRHFLSILIIYAYAADHDGLNTTFSKGRADGVFMPPKHRISREAFSSFQAIRHFITLSAYATRAIATSAACHECYCSHFRIDDDARRATRSPTPAGHTTAEPAARKPKNVAISLPFHYFRAMRHIMRRFFVAYVSARP